MKESKETSKDEMAESPAKQKEEAASGTEEHIIPEEYQHQVHKIIHKAPKHHLSYVRGRLNDREDEMRKEEMKPSKSPKVMTMEGME